MGRPWWVTLDTKTDSENIRTTSVTQLINMMTTTMTMTVAAAMWPTVRWWCWRRLLRCNRSCLRCRILGIIVINTVLCLAVNSPSDHGDFNSRPSNPACLIVIILNCFVAVLGVFFQVLCSGRRLKQLKMFTHPVFHISANKLLRFSAKFHRLPRATTEQLAVERLDIHCLITFNHRCDTLSVSVRWRRRRSFDYINRRRWWSNFQYEYWEQ